MSEDVIGRGWPFPVRPGPDGRLHLVGGERKIQQSIWIILATSRGERLMREDFGAGIPRDLFSPNDPRNRALIAVRAKEALIRHEPRIDVLDVRVDDDVDEPSRVLIHVDYRIRVNNAAFNLVFPYYLTEGVG